jgi:hypothetical protein
VDPGLANPALLADEFVTSVERFATYENVAQSFYPPRPPHAFGARLKATKDLVLRLEDLMRVTPSDAADRVHDSGDHPEVREVAATALAFEYVDRELLLHRTQSPARWDTGKSNRGGIRIDVLLASSKGRRPIIAELKLPGDMDPFFALIQALTGAAHLATPAQYARVREHLPEGRFPALDSPPRVDIYTLFVGKTEGPNQPEFMRAAQKLPPKLLAHDGFSQSVRRIAGINVNLDAKCNIASDVRFAWERHLVKAPHDQPARLLRNR